MIVMTKHGPGRVKTGNSHEHTEKTGQEVLETRMMKRWGEMGEERGRGGRQRRREGGEDERRKWAINLGCLA